MRNAVLYTEKPLEMEKCLQQIKTVYKNVGGSEFQIYIGKSPKSIAIWLPSTDLSDPVETLDMTEDIDKIPFENPYFTHIDFHSLKMLQAAVKVIIPLYPEMIIWTDDDKFYSTEEFINTEFDF